MITIDEAKKILLQATSRLVDNEHPFAWVSELLEETEDEYFFDVNIYAEGEDPEDTEEPPLRRAVNKHTGKWRDDVIFEMDS